MYCFSGVGGGSLNFCQVLCLGHFLRNHKGLGHAYIWMSAAQSYHQYLALTYFYGSLTLQIFINFCGVFAFR